MAGFVSLLVCGALRKLTISLESAIFCSASASLALMRGCSAPAVSEIVPVLAGRISIPLKLLIRILSVFSARSPPFLLVCSFFLPGPSLVVVIGITEIFIEPDSIGCTFLLPAFFRRLPSLPLVSFETGQMPLNIAKASFRVIQTITSAGAINIFCFLGALRL